MSILDTLKPASSGRLPEKVPRDIDDKIRRGRVKMRKDSVKRKLCQKFFEGQHYWFENPTGGLNFQTTGMVGVVSSTKSTYRIRNTYNFIAAIVESKVSAATQRVPGYEVTPSTDDPDDEAAASLAGQVAAYGYDKWWLRRYTTEAVTNALVQREAFVMPYFDANVGPFKRDSTGKWVGLGEIRHLSLTRDEVMWEPGVNFLESRWYGIERARLKEEVQKIPGFAGGTLETDAQASDAPEGKKSAEMILVTEYLERPCPDYPQGRRVFIANGRPIVDFRRDPACEASWSDWWEPYPVMDANGDVSDDPPLHRISYTVNPGGDDLGLVERIIDLQRTINDCWNKLLEIKNRALMLQMLAPKGSGVPRRDDTPGATIFYNVVGGQVPTWEKAPDPQYIAQLITLLREAKEDLRSLAADIDVQPDPRLAGSTANLAVQQGQQRWQSFLGDLAEFHSRLMRHDLMLVARYYDEQRQIDIRGQYGWQPVAAFRGQDLRSQVNVRVLPGSLEAKSRQAIQQEIQFIQANWPGAIPVEAALGVLHGGSAEGLIRSYQNHVAKAQRIVRRLRTGPQAMLTFGTHWDPNAPNLQTGTAGVDVPNWMPAPQDNIQIWRQVIGDYMTTEDYEKLGPEVQFAFQKVWDGLEHAEQLRAAKQAAQQQMQAQSLGMGNAAAPQVPPPLPDRAGFTPNNASPVPAA